MVFTLSGMVTFVRDVLLAKADSPMVTSLSGSTSVLTPVPEKALLPMVTSPALSGRNRTVFNPTQFSNALFPTEVIVLGKTTSLIFLPFVFLNAASPIAVISFCS